MLIPLAAAALTATGLASEPERPSEEPDDEVRLVVRAVGEALDDPHIGTVYDSTTVMPGVAVVMPVWSRLSVGIEAGYRRLRPEDDDQVTFDLIPITVPLEWRFGPAQGPVIPYVGLGPAVTIFNERFPPQSVDDTTGVVSGGRIGADTRVGLRIDTGMVQPTMAPTSALRAVELDLYFGRRFHRVPDEGEGLSFGAWRGSAGLSLVF